MTEPPPYVEFSVPAKLLDSDVIEGLKALGAIEFEEGWARVSVVAQREPAWIRASSRLPEEGVLVNVFLAAARSADQAGVRLAALRDGAWDFHDDFGVGGEVTHWAPLPELPL